MIGLCIEVTAMESNTAFDRNDGACLERFAVSVDDGDDVPDGVPV